MDTFLAIIHPFLFTLSVYCSGLLWSKQFYHYIVEAWMNGDPEMPNPSAQRYEGRNKEWKHLFNRDVISMPDKWEYPWVMNYINIHFLERCTYNMFTFVCCILSILFET